MADERLTAVTDLIWELDDMKEELDEFLPAKLMVDIVRLQDNARAELSSLSEEARFAFEERQFGMTLAGRATAV